MSFALRDGLRWCTGREHGIAEPFQDATRHMTPKLHRIVVCANEGILNFTMQVRVPKLNQGLDLNIIDRFVLNEAGQICTAQAYWDTGSVSVPEGMAGFVPNIDEAYEK